MDFRISKRKPVLAAFTCSGELSKAGLLLLLLCILSHFACLFLKSSDVLFAVVKLCSWSSISCTVCSEGNSSQKFTYNIYSLFGFSQFDAF